MNKLRTLVLLISCVCFSSCTKMDRLTGYNISVNFDGKCDSYKINKGEKLHIEPVSKENFSFLGYYYFDSQITNTQGDMLEPFNYDFSIELTPKFEGKKFNVYTLNTSGFVDTCYSVKFYESMPDLFSNKVYVPEFVGYKCGTVMVSDKNGYFPGYEILNENYEKDGMGQVELKPIYNSSLLRNISYTYTTDGGTTFVTEKVRTDKALSDVLPKDTSNKSYLWAKEGTYFYDDFLDPLSPDIKDDVELTAVAYFSSDNGCNVYRSFDGKKEFYFVTGNEYNAQLKTISGIDELFIYGRNKTARLSIKLPESDHSINTFIQDAKFTSIDYFYDDSSCKDEIQNTLNIYGNVSFVGVERNPNCPAITCKNLKLNILEQSSLTINANSGSVGGVGDNGTSSHHDGYQGKQGTSGADGIHVLKELVINNKGNLKVVGGVGGKGGTGGKGYDSHTGFLDIGSYDAGKGGKGGKGGTGGNGIVFDTNAIFEVEEGLENIVFLGGGGGTGGTGGDGGAASTSVLISHPAGQPGAYGDPGDPGEKYVGSQGEILNV